MGLSYANEPPLQSPSAPAPGSRAGLDNGEGYLLIIGTVTSACLAQRGSKRCPSSRQKQTPGKGLRCKGNQNIVLSCRHFGTSQVVQMVKNLPAMQETWVWSLGWEDPLEKEMATHSSILAWRIPWAEKSGRLQSMGLQRVGHDWATNTYSYVPSERPVANIVAASSREGRSSFPNRLPKTG